MLRTEWFQYLPILHIDTLLHVVEWWIELDMVQRGYSFLLQCKVLRSQQFSFINGVVLFKFEIPFPDEVEVVP